MRLNIFIFTMVLKMVCASYAYGDSALAIGKLDENTCGGAGCYFYSKGNCIFRAEDSNSGEMIINDKKVSFKTVAHQTVQKQDSHPDSVGDISLWLLASEETKIETKLTVTPGCKSDQCSVVNYDAVFLVNHGKEKTSIKAKGYCGS